MSNFPPQLPHGDFREILPDVFFLTGQIVIGADKTSRHSRNMIVIRDGPFLALVNTIRLDSARLAALDALGTVNNIVKLGAFHGRDDAFYIDRYGADLWAPPGMTYSRGEKTTHLLTDGQAGPNPDATAFVLDTPKLSEAILHLERHGGVLIACDSFQNTLPPDEDFNYVATETESWSSVKKAEIAQGWRNFAEPKPKDFAPLEELKFRHLLCAHGKPLLDEAHNAVSASIAELFVT